MLKRQKLQTKQCIIGQIIPYEDNTTVTFPGTHLRGRSLFRINRGTDDDDRMGRTIMVKDIEINVQYYNDHNSDFSGDEVTHYHLWLDKQPQNTGGENIIPEMDEIYAEPALQNIWNPLPFPGPEITATFNSEYTLAFQNPTNEKRFILLAKHSKRIIAPSSQTITTPMPTVAWPATYEFTWHLPNLNIPVTYQYNTVALSDYVVKTNSLFIVSKSTTQAETNQPRLSLQAKIVYTDGT